MGIREGGGESIETVRGKKEKNRMRKSRKTDNEKKVRERESEVER